MLRTSNFIELKSQLISATTISNAERLSLFVGAESWTAERWRVDTSVCVHTIRGITLVILDEGTSDILATRPSCEDLRSIRTLLRLHRSSAAGELKY